MVKPTVAVIGNCYFDEIYTIENYPNPDQKVLASDLVIVLGGSATNTSVGLAKLRMSPHLFTVMGDDEDAYRLFKLIRKKGIRTQYINHIEGKSGRTIILLDKNKTSTKIGYQGVCSDMRDTILFEGLSNQKFTHVHLASTGIEVIQKAVKYKTDQTYSLDFGAKTLQASNEELLQIFESLDYIFLNRSTFARLFDIPINKLAQLDIRYDLIITAGTDGIYALINGKMYHEPIIPVNVVDSTGAGDAAAAAMIYAYQVDLGPQDILKTGVRAASIKIETFGGSNGHATRKEITEFE